MRPRCPPLAACLAFVLACAWALPAAMKVHEVGRHSVDRSWVPGRHGGWRLDLTVSDMPVLLRGDLAGVSVVGVEHPEFPSDLR